MSGLALYNPTQPHVCPPRAVLAVAEGAAECCRCYNAGRPDCGRIRSKPVATITIQEAQAQLSDLIHRLTPGDEVLITENNEPVAKLARTEPKKQWPCKAGSAKGTIH